MHRTSPHPLQRWAASFLALLLVVAASVLGAGVVRADDAVVVPSITVSPSTDVDSAVANTFTVSGTGFVGAGAQFGAYVLFGPTSTWSGGSPLPGDGWLAQAHVPAASISGGAFTTTLTVAADTLDPATSYQVATSAAHGLSGTNRSLDSFAPVTVKQLPPPEPVADPDITVTPSADIDSTVDNTFTVSGTGFVGAGAANGAYVLIGETSVWSGGSALPTGGWLAQAHVPPASISGGAFTTTLTVPKNTLDPAKSYQVATSAAHRLSGTDRTLDSFEPITVKPVVVPEPVFEPAISVFLSDGVTPYVAGTPVYTGDSLVVKGTGFDPAANLGGRGVPIPATSPQGNYVVLGSFTDAWKPVSSANSGSRKSLDQKWAITDATYATIPSNFLPGVAGQRVVLGTDGAFTATLQVKGFADAIAGGVFGVYTYAAGGAPSHGAQELSVPINYVGDRPVEPVVDPKITVTPSTITDPSQATVLTVTGTGFRGAGAANGAYVLFGETSVWSGGRPLVSDGWVAQTLVGTPQIIDGAFSTTLTVPAGAVSAEKEYHVATSAAHRLSSSDRTLDSFAAVTVQGATPDPVPTAVVQLDGRTVTTATQGDTLTFAGTGFPAGEPVTAVVHSDPVTVGTKNADDQGAVSFTWQVPADFETGDHTVHLGEASAPLQILAATVEPPVTCAGVADATLTWGVFERFRDYVTGSIARGSISTTGAVTQAADNGVFTWTAGTGSYDDDAATGAINWAGAVTFTGHGGVLQLTFSGLELQLLSPTSGRLVADVTGTDQGGGEVGGTGVVLADLTFAAARSAEAVTITGAQVVLTAAGATAFADFYDAGTVLDPLSAVLPLQDEADCEPVDPGTDPGPGPGNGATPAVSVLLNGNPVTSATQGDTLSLTGTGFPVGEQVTAVVNSDPVTVGQQVVDASGAVSFSWTIPADFETGAHTVSFTAPSASASVGLTVVASAVGGVTPPPSTTSPTTAVTTTPVADRCYDTRTIAGTTTAATAGGISGGSLTWGVKSSFRSYVQGSIANGSVSGSSTFSGASGSWTGSSGTLSYSGSLRFTGHDGLLNLSVSNPRVRFTSASTAELVVNVSSKGLSGPDVNQSGVVFATLSLPSPSTSGNRTSWNGASATLTDAGAAGFAGFYGAGTALDPVSFSITVSEGTAATSTPDRTETVEVDCVTGKVLSGSDSGLASTGADVQGALVAALGVLTFGLGLLLISRRRAVAQH